MGNAHKNQINIYANARSSKLNLDTDSEYQLNLG